METLGSFRLLSLKSNLVHINFLYRILWMLLTCICMNVLWKIKYCTTLWLNFETRTKSLYVLKKRFRPKVLYFSKKRPSERNEEGKFYFSRKIIYTAMKKSFPVYATDKQLNIQHSIQVFMHILSVLEKITLEKLIQQKNLRMKNLSQIPGRCSKHVLQFQPYILKNNILAWEIIFVLLLCRENWKMDGCLLLSIEEITLYFH